MATINGSEYKLEGLDLAGIADKIVEVTGTTNGRGLLIQFRHWEEASMIDEADLDFDETLVNHLKDAIAARTGVRPEDIPYEYSGGRFTS